MDLKALPPDWWTSGVACTAMADVFRMHVVGIAMDYRLAKSGKEKIAHYTGSIFQHNGATLWLTAKHVIEEMRVLLFSGDYVVRRSRLVDHGTTKDAESMPFAPELLRMYVAPGLDLDFGFVELSPLLAAGVLEGGKVKPLTEHIWMGRESAAVEGYWVVGYPAESVTKHVTPIAPGLSRYALTSTLVSLPVRALEASEIETDADFWADGDAFYGQLLPITGVEPPAYIEGMSGGPLFSICRTSDNRMKYHLHGIQRSWKSARRIVRCERIESIIPHLV